MNIKLRKKDIDSILIAFLFAIFCITKMVRGSISTTTVQGGIWNYISLLFYPLFLYGLLSRKLFIHGFAVWGILYALTALMIALFYTSSLTQSSVYNVLMVPYSFLVFSVFFFFSEDSAKMYRIIELSFWVCFLINLFAIARYQLGDYSHRPQASDIYYTLGLYPFILIGDKKRKTWIVSALVVIATFLSDKRTGIIALAVALAVFAFIKTYVSGGDIGRKLRVIIVVSISIVLAFYVCRYLDNRYKLGVFARIERLNADGGSGRRELYRLVWNNYRNSNIIQKIFGHGVYATSSICGILAHDDFLEVLYDFGLFAFIFFCAFYYSLISNLIKMIKCKSPYAPALAVSIFTGLSLSLFSYMLVYYTYSTVYVAFWGYCFSLEEKRLLREEKNR